MQIFQWLLKKASQEPPKMVSKSTTKKCDKGEKIKSKNIVVLVDGSGKRRHVKGVEKSKLDCENLVLFRFIQRKDVSRPFFYHALNLKGLGSFGRSRDSDKTKKSKETGVSAALGGNKVLPISDSSVSSSRNENNSKQFHDKTKSCRKKSVSRMKELLKWSAAAKSLKNGVVASTDGDEVGEYESPKISFRWEMVGRCSTTVPPMITAVLRASSGLKDDQIQCADLRVEDDAAGIGNWITTDSEFVVLEL